MVDNDRRILDEQLKARLLAEQKKLDAAVKTYEESKRLMAEYAENIAAIQRLLGIESSEDNMTEDSSVKRMRPIKPRRGTVGDYIGTLFFENPEISAEDVIALVKARFTSNITKSSFNTWDSYYRTGRYIMDERSYIKRYGHAPPY